MIVKPESSRGLTFVEILVTLAVLGVLAAILIPSASKMKASAMSTQCVGKLRDIGIGLNNYFLENGRRYPDLATARESREEEIPTLDTVLLEYVPDEFIFQCPADHSDFFERTGSSYFWNSLVNGQRLGNMDLLGMKSHESGIPVVSDKENFHKHIGDGVNVLYADGHVLREVQFVVDNR